MLLRNALILLITLSTLYGCCDKKQKGRVVITQQELDNIPYTTGQEITFIHSGGSEVVFRVNKRQTTPRQVDGCVECCEDYYILDEHITDLFASYPKITATLFINSLHPDEGTHKQFRASVNNFYFPLFLPFDSCKTENYTTCLDTVSLGGGTYYNVIKSSVPYTDSTQVTPSVLYYSASKGILRIEMSNKETYTLKQ